MAEAVLIEVGNALSAVNRTDAVQFIEQCYHTPNLRVVTVDTPLLTRALQLYRERPDQTWGLRDCISFVVMQEQGLTDASLLMNILFKQGIGHCWGSEPSVQVHCANTPG